jgi:hypothetical protein
MWRSRYFPRGIWCPTANLSPIASCAAELEHNEDVRMGHLGMRPLSPAMIVCVYPRSETIGFISPQSDPLI